MGSPRLITRSSTSSCVQVSRSSTRHRIADQVTHNLRETIGIPMPRAGSDDRQSEFAFRMRGAQLLQTQASHFREIHRTLGEGHSDRRVVAARG
jgi:hypothetical protein